MSNLIKVLTLWLENIPTGMCNHTGAIGTADSYCMHETATLTSCTQCPFNVDDIIRNSNDSEHKKDTAVHNNMIKTLEDFYG